MKYVHRPQFVIVNRPVLVHGRQVISGQSEIEAYDSLFADLDRISATLDEIRSKLNAETASKKLRKNS